MRGGISLWGFSGSGRGLVTAGLAVLLGGPGVLLAGCSGSDGTPQAQVASLPAATSAGSGEPAATTAPGKPTTGRPQMRLDDSPEQRDALIRAWDACLVKNGARYTPDRGRGAAAGAAAGPGQTAVVVRTVAEPIPKAAKAACTDKLPLGPPEQDPNLNPHYRDDSLANVKCLRQNGIKVHLVNDTSVDPNGLSWTYDDSAGTLPANEDKIEHDCELAAFGGRN
jgi:hypothetical protein